MRPSLLIVISLLLFCLFLVVIMTTDRDHEAYNLWERVTGNELNLSYEEWSLLKESPGVFKAYDKK